ncbi:hypothetical protein D0A38_20625 [Xanthomonas campestris pv. incanae]|nr:hypothetical protein D0A38_20625 [Xanthomonas campestris pv. incanae]
MLTLLSLSPLCNSVVGLIFGLKISRAHKTRLYADLRSVPLTLRNVVLLNRILSHMIFNLFDI